MGSGGPGRGAMALATTLALMLVGCGASPEACTTDDDCGGGATCRAGSCFTVVMPRDCLDEDGDGYFTGAACEASQGIPDCDDTDASINPGVVDDCGPDMMGDGIDQNCMNGTDDGCSCDAGGGVTRQDCGQGLCAGTRVCTDGTWGDCEPVVDPVPEDCGPDGMGNGLDEDCDGEIDNGCIMCPERPDGMGTERICPGESFCSSNDICN